MSHQYNQVFPSWLAFTGEEKVLDHLNFCTKKKEKKEEKKEVMTGELGYVQGHTEYIWISCR